MKKRIALMVLCVLLILSLSACGSKKKFTQEAVVDPESYAGTSFDFFAEMAEPSYLIPALNQYFVPQGMDVWQEKNLLMISGYFSEPEYSAGSVILTVDLKTGKYKGEYYIQNADGTDYDGHAGGIAVTEKNVFISDAGALLRIPLNAFQSGKRVKAVAIAEKIKVPVNAAYCNYSVGMLWVGDFQGSSSPTPTWRHLENRDGETYYAWCVGYRLTNETENEFTQEQLKFSADYATPDCILSIPDRIQGITVSEDHIVLSQSYGRKNDSTIFYYNNLLDTVPHTALTVNGARIPVWFLDSDVLSFQLDGALPMSEGITMDNDRLLILFESGADRYRNNDGKNPTDHIWSMEQNERKKQ